METASFIDESGKGSWIVILGCPLDEKHDLHDPEGKYSGPSFAQYATCEHQAGKNFQILGADGYYDGAELFPESLVCGIKGRDGG